LEASRILFEKELPKMKYILNKKISQDIKETGNYLKAFAEMVCCDVYLFHATRYNDIVTKTEKYTPKEKGKFNLFLKSYKIQDDTYYDKYEPLVKELIGSQEEKEKSKNSIRKELSAIVDFSFKKKQE
jgi:hypothetical protein